MKPAHRLTLFALALGLTAPAARSASPLELLDQVPAPPADVATALSWTENGRIVTPEYTRLKQAIEAERASIIALNGGAPPAALAPTSIEGEPAEVQLALKAYGDYLAANSGKQEPAAAIGKRARWLHAAMAGKLGALLGAMKPCPVPCTDPAAQAQNQPLLPARNKLAEQDLLQWNALFSDWLSKRRAIVSEAQARLSAAGDGTRAVGPAARSALAGYRAAMLREVEATLSVTELAVKRANAIETADVDAVSGSTYTPRNKKS